MTVNYLYFIITVVVLLDQVFCVTVIQDLPDQITSTNQRYEFFVGINDFHSKSGVEYLDYSPISKMPSWLTSRRYPFGKQSFTLSDSGTYDVFVRDRIAYLADGETGFRILDVTDPSSPRHIFEKAEPGFNYRALEVVGDYCYTITESGVLEIFDVKNPSRTTLLGYQSTEETSFEAWGLAVDEVKQNVYIVGRGESYGMIVSLNITNKMDPKKMDSESLTGDYGRDVYIEAKDDGNRIYVVSCPNGGLNRFVADYRGMLRPDGARNIARKAYSIVKSGSYYYIGTEDCFYIYFYNWMLAWTMRGYICENFGSYSKVFEMGRYFVVNAENGVYIVDVLDVMAPVLVYSFNTTLVPQGNIRNGLFVDGNCAYVPVSNMGMFVLGLNTLSFEGIPRDENTECLSIKENNGLQPTYSVEVEVRASDSPFSYLDESFLISVVCSMASDSRVGEQLRSKYARSVSSVVTVLFLLVCSSGCVCGLLMCVASFGFLIFMVILIGSFGGSITLFLGYKKMDEEKKRKFFLEEDKMDRIMKEGLLDDRKGAATINVNKSLFEINYNDVEVLSMIGSGGSKSVVFHGRWKSKEIAFKCFKTSDLLGDDNDFTDFEREVNVMSSIRHPYCLGFYGCCLYPPRVGIVMEYCENGDLKSFLTRNPSFPIKKRIRILGQVSDGMEYLHERKVIHRDIKSENILLNKNLDAKIMDFGVSRIYEKMTIEKTRSVGTAMYMAPEVVQGGEYDYKCDVFSFSIVIWEVLANNFKPYGKGFSGNIEYKVSTNEDYRPSVKEIGWHIRNQYKKVIDIMQLSWKGDPIERPSFVELKNVLGSYFDVNN